VGNTLRCLPIPDNCIHSRAGCAASSTLSNGIRRHLSKHTIPFSGSYCGLPHSSILINTLTVLRRTERKPSKFLTKPTHAIVRAGTLAKFTLRREPISVAYYSAKNSLRSRGLIVKNAIHSTIDRLTAALERVRTLRGDQNAATTGAFSPTQPTNHAGGNANKPF